MSLSFFSFFFFNDTATTEIYTLSLHDALPICLAHPGKLAPYEFFADIASDDPRDLPRRVVNLLYSLRSEEHTSELQSRLHLVCRLLLEKKKKNMSCYIRTAVSASGGYTSRQRE